MLDSLTISCSDVVRNFMSRSVIFYSIIRRTDLFVNLLQFVTCFILGPADVSVDF